MEWQFCPSRSALRFGTRSEQGTCRRAIPAHFGISFALCHRFRSASGRRSTFPCLAECSHNAQPIRLRPRSSRRCPKQIKVRHSDKQCHSQAFKAALHWAWSGATLPNGSGQFRMNPRWIPFWDLRDNKVRFFQARFPIPSSNPQRRIRCTCLLATSNGNGGKRRALPGNCSRPRKVRIRIRGLTPGRC